MSKVDWKPYMTLPNTGEQVMLYFAGGGMCMVPATGPKVLTKQEELELSRITGEEPNPAFMPTHWAPLPEPPSDAKFIGKAH